MNNALQEDMRYLRIPHLRTQKCASQIKCKGGCPACCGCSSTSILATRGKGVRNETQKKLAILSSLAEPVDNYVTSIMIMTTANNDSDHYCNHDDDDDKDEPVEQHQQ